MTKQALSPSLFTDDRSGLCLAGGTRQLGRLHRSQRGNIAVLFMFLGLVFFCLMAMVWNTGKMTSAKIETQTAADAAAYSSAVWTSRAMNLTVGTNMLIIRLGSAHAAGAAASWAKDGMSNAFFWYPIIQAGKKAGPTPAHLVAMAAAYAAAQLYVNLIARPAWMTFTAAANRGIAAYNNRTFLRRIDQLYKMQKDWIAATDVAIKDQLDAIMEYYDCDIRVVRPGRPGPIKPPLKRGNAKSIAVPLGGRTAFELYSPTNKSWRRQQQFLPYPGPGRMYLPGWFSFLQPRWLWTGGSIWGYHKAVSYAGKRHHVLTTQRSVSWNPLFSFEYGPRKRNLEEWKDFTIVAVAVKRDDNTTSGQPPNRPLDFMAQGVFSETVVPVAYAQAETFNGIDGHVAKAAGAFAPLRKVGAFPFRMWTTWGWQWQPRLTRGDQLGNAIKGDPTLLDQQWLGQAGIKAAGDVDGLMLH